MVTKFGGQILATKFGFVPDCLHSVMYFFEISDAYSWLAVSPWAEHINCYVSYSWHHKALYDQSGTKSKLVAKILATNSGELLCMDFQS